MFVVPKPFEEKFSKILGKEYEDFSKLFTFKARKSIRINSIKISKEEIKERLEEIGWKLEQIPWFEYGFWVSGESVLENLAKTLEYFLGYYYIQEASSMLPPIVLWPTEEDKVLDMCAAPGSKTTQMAQMMNNEGVIVAVDDSLKRLKALRNNLQRMGVKNTIVVLMDARKLWRKSPKFNKILLDVPCSGSGTFVTTESIFKTWSPFLVKRMSNLQKELISAAWKCLEEDGELVYSTCSLDPEENEEVIDFAIKNLGAKVEKVRIKNVKTRKGIRSYNGKDFDKEVEKCIRIWPQDNLTEGFFICKLRK